MYHQTCKLTVASRMLKVTGESNACFKHCLLKTISEQKGFGKN